MTAQLWRIETPSVVIGFDVDPATNIIIACAPYLRRNLLGKTLAFATVFATSRGWVIARNHEPEPEA